jgi:putative ABC transport system substrate-binding protein
MKDDSQMCSDFLAAMGGTVTRRRLLLGLGIAVALPSASAWPQTRQLHRIAFLSGSRQVDTVESFAALRDGLRDLGYREGDNLVIEARWADYAPERLAALASEIATLRPAVVVTQGAAHGPAARLSPPLPVVFLHSGDPVEAGLAESFARPGRNATGISLLALDLTTKRMEMLKQMAPKLRRVAFLANPEHPGEQRELAASRSAAAQLGLTVTYYQTRNPAELDTALVAVAAARPDGVVLFSDALMFGQRQKLAAFFLQHQIPSATGWSDFPESGHLLSYGPERRAAWRRVAYFVDKIVKGARPGELPIELPTVLETVINRRTATAMHLGVPPTILVRADRVID